jgi:hypothetical protein
VIVALPAFALCRRLLRPLPSPLRDRGGEAELVG